MLTVRGGLCSRFGADITRLSGVRVVILLTRSCRGREKVQLGSCSAGTSHHLSTPSCWRVLGLGHACELGGQCCLQGLARLGVHQALELVPAVGILHPWSPCGQANGRVVPSGSGYLWSQSQGGFIPRKNLFSSLKTLPWSSCGCSRHVQAWTSAEQPHHPWVLHRSRRCWQAAAASEGERLLLRTWSMRTAPQREKCPKSPPPRQF